MMSRITVLYIDKRHSSTYYADKVSAFHQFDTDKVSALHQLCADKVFALDQFYADKMST